MSKWLDRTVSSTLILGTAAIAISVVYRTFLGASADKLAVPKAKSFKEWRALESAGYHVDGPTNAPIVLTVFSDVQCPACRSFHKNVRDVMRAYPGKIKLTYVSHPLAYHKFAMAGAQATDCISSSHGDVLRWLDVVFEKQDSIGVKSWGSFATEAGISDSTRVVKCASNSDSSAAPAIRAFFDWADRVGVRGTPTIVLDGVVLPIPPTHLELDSLIRGRLGRR